MSVLGTGVAAGVAQTSLQAQQAARERDRKKAQEAENARRVRESFEAHLHAVDKVDETEPIDRFKIEGHLSQDNTQHHDIQALQSEGKPQQVDPSSDEPAQESAPVQPVGESSEGQLYRHLDVKG